MDAFIPSPLLPHIHAACYFLSLQDWVLGKDAELHLSNLDCPFENRDGPCLAFHHQLGGYPLMKLKVPSFTLEVGAQFMNYHDLEMRALHHLVRELKSPSLPFVFPIRITYCHVSKIAHALSFLHII